MIRGLILMAFLCAGAMAQVTYQDILKGPGENWLTYAGSYNGWRFAPGHQITPQNVGSLVPNWIFRVPDAHTLETTPIVYQGVMYVTNGNADVYVIDADGGAPRRLTTSSANDTVPRRSADGRWIYFNSDRTGRSEIWREPADGGQETQITHQGGFDPRESPDGKVLYYLKRRNAAAIWRVQGGAESIAAESVVTDFGWWQPVSDGIYLVQRTPTSNPASEQIEFFDFATGKASLITVLTKPASGYGGFCVSPDRRHLLVAQVDQNDSDIMMVENFR